MNSIEKILKDSGAWHEGHTEFRNGLHGSGWIQKDAVVRNPVYLDQIAKIQAEQISQEFPDIKLLIGAITGGALIVSHVAKHLGTECGVILGKQEPIVFHDMRIPKEGEPIVLVEDIISSGKDMNKFIQFLKNSNANVLGVSVWMNRKEQEILGVKIVNLIPTPFEIYDKEKCVLCANNLTIQYEDVRE